jgi:hypothetical protein
MADVVPRDGPPPGTGGPIATAVSPGARPGRFTGASRLAASPPQPGDGYLHRDERHDAAGLIAGGLLSTCACLLAGGVRGVSRLAAPMPGHVDGELGTGGDVQFGEHVREVGLHGPA